MLSVSKTMNILADGGLIKDWRLSRRDARFCRSDSPLFEKIIIITPTVDEPLLRVDNEIYGKKAALYFYCKSERDATTIINALLQHGGKPNMRWCSDKRDRFEMPVSYFKGCRWWE